MVLPPNRRSRKRLATRQEISNAATRLFLDRGFDRVTIDEVAAAADVGRMTVFNHFPRKEDLFFDRDEEAREVLRAALRQREPGISPVESLRRLAHRLVAEQHPFVRFTNWSPRFISTIEQSATLRSRVREIRDEIAGELTLALAEAAGREAADPSARLAAALFVAIWTVALAEAHAVFKAGRNLNDAQTAFLALVDQGSVGLAASLAGTPYA